MQLIKYFFYVAIKSTLSFIIILLLFICTINITRLFAVVTLYPKQSSSALTHWSEVDLVYHKDFPCTEYKHYQPVGGCSLIKRSSATSYLLRCVEQVHLLLPTDKAKTLREEQQVKGYLDPGTEDNIMTGHAFSGIHAHIALIKPVNLNFKPVHGTENRPLVKALFVRHALNVKAYQFKNLRTGSISTIKATDNHPFYLENKKAFVPIGRVSSSDRLITATGQAVKLVCPEGGKKHCGVASANASPVLVYNMEIYPKHTYFVGAGSQILVHNGCNDRVSGSDQKMVKDPISLNTIPEKMAIRLGHHAVPFVEDRWEEEFYEVNTVRKLILAQNPEAQRASELRSSSIMTGLPLNYMKNIHGDTMCVVNVLQWGLDSNGKFIGEICDMSFLGSPIWEEKMRRILRNDLISCLKCKNSHIDKMRGQLYNPNSLFALIAGQDEKQALLSELEIAQKAREGTMSYLSRL